MANSNPSKTKAYEFFLKLVDMLEEGQQLPIYVPEGFDESETEIFEEIRTEISRAFQYRKFAYEHMLEYLETDRLSTYNEEKKWLKSANYSLNLAIINITSLKIE